MEFLQQNVQGRERSEKCRVVASESSEIARMLR